MIHTDGNPTVCSRIKENRNKEELNLVAVELFKTLGFCTGFLNKDPAERFNEYSAAFPFDEDTLTIAMHEFRKEYLLGKELSDG